VLGASVFEIAGGVRRIRGLDRDIFKPDFNLERGFCLSRKGEFPS
jgi:hypothetical protein